MNRLVKELMSFGIFLFFSFLTSSQAASFDCRKAQTTIEKSICKSPVLSSLDEQYADLFNKRKLEDIGNKGKISNLKKDAISALHWRDDFCKTEFCLLSWYENRLEKLGAKNTNAVRPELTISEIFHSLNMRTMATSIKDAMDSHCKTYPADYFPSASITELVENRVSLKHNGIEWFFKIEDEDSLSWGDSPPGLDFFYGRGSPLAFQIETADWHAHWYEPSWPKRCMRVEVDWPTMNKPRVLYLKAASGSGNDDVKKLQNSPVGEIAFHGPTPSQRLSLRAKVETSEFAIPYHLSSRPIHGGVEGRQIGILLIALQLSEIESTSAAVLMLLYGDTAPVTPSLIYRRHDAALIVFEKSGAWVNMSPANESPRWVDMSGEPQLQSAFVPRDRVIEEATKVKVLSAHRLRASASTDSEILTVMGRNGDEDLYPLEVRGDWLKVHYVTPRTHYLYEPVLLETLGPEHTQFQGWLKFRDASGKENIDVEYYFD